MSGRTCIHLTPAEVQSNFDRVQWAEGLIRQLPETHEGRNSWLLNYGSQSMTDQMDELSPEQWEYLKDRAGMTDQIAPSLAEQFEHMAKRYRTRLEIVALLTRAAALARAAEKITEWFPLRIDRDEMGYECVFCYGWHLDTPEVEHKADCAWMQLRALVSSEGKGE